jgi:hypothetical protein
MCYKKKELSVQTIPEKKERDKRNVVNKLYFADQN